jgi:phosphoribosylamine--glycine ligase
VKVLIIDPNGTALDVAWRAQNNGHDIRLFIRQKEKTKYIGRGLVEIVDDFKPWCNWADLVFNSDNCLYLRDIDNLRRDGRPVVSASEESARWELERKHGQDILRKNGISVLPAKEFHDYDAAIAYVEKRSTRLVSKPSGTDPDKALSYVSADPADMIFMLQRWKKLGKLKAPFLLQDFMSGTEMAVGGWFGPGGWSSGWLENWEFKKFANNDLGITTGEQGTVMRYVLKSKLADRMLVPLTGDLHTLDYCGYVDVNCIIEDNGKVWPLEFTMRPGWPTCNIQQELHEDFIVWLAELTEGIDNRKVRLDRIAVGVVMSVPDYPYSHLTRKEVIGIPVYGLDARMLRHWHPCEMMMSQEPVPHMINGELIGVPCIVTAGDYVGVMTATADTVREATTACYRRLKRLTVPNSPMYRTDIGNRLAKELPSLQRNGFATGMVYSGTS